MTQHFAYSHTDTVLNYLVVNFDSDAVLIIYTYYYNILKGCK